MRPACISGLWLAGLLTACVSPRAVVPVDEAIRQVRDYSVKVAGFVTEADMQLQTACLALANAQAAQQAEAARLAEALKSADLVAIPAIRKLVRERFVVAESVRDRVVRLAGQTAEIRRAARETAALQEGVRTGVSERSASRAVTEAHARCVAAETGLAVVKLEVDRLKSDWLISKPDSAAPEQSVPARLIVKP
ncbi:MAG: hypothetical protein A2498_08420 [Lentisphaerae bacterium RIFOXYC12_FULL_60_16]|nr:MAG: hypothetical protein A2498_08420 [Lentisphaerae bacterium RIFOXYC12_FULL_60_16]OGV74333.1 MAG: hypothetical protein A2269_02705 [Lentisphaerae bacterium RIFOXYA12_FULL_60_10]OGV75697.1 MAG: hypothetical protein A2340_12505 [Lentisphaerae bacterium RIFOXYB12_FULL_60_10]